MYWLTVPPSASMAGTATAKKAFKQPDHFVRRVALGEGGEVADVAEQHGDVALLAAEIELGAAGLQRPGDGLRLDHAHHAANPPPAHGEDRAVEQHAQHEHRTPSRPANCPGRTPQRPGRARRGGGPRVNSAPGFEAASGQQRPHRAADDQQPKRRGQPPRRGDERAIQQRGHHVGVDLDARHLGFRRRRGRTAAVAAVVAEASGACTA